MFLAKIAQDFNIKIKAFTFTKIICCLKLNRLNIIVFTGFIAIVGVLAMQLLTISRAYSFEKNEVADKIHFALQDVVTRIYTDNNSELPAESPIKKVSEDYYVVNVNDVFEQDVLEYYLKNELQKVKLDMDYEYAIYDCGSNAMVYGEYIDLSGKPDPSATKCVNCFTTRPGLVYYFAVRFPDMVHSYISSMQQYWIYTGILVLVLVIYTYSVILLLRQKKYTELQKDFINNMTHEFKTPLSSILIASNYAAKQKVIEASPKLHQYLNIIIEQSNKLNHHIERILNVAKTGEGIAALHKTAFNLHDTLLMLKENVQLKFENATINVASDVPGYTIAADEFHFYNIAYNIVENAIKYGSANPVININVSSHNGGLLLQFSDNGPGIPQGHLDFIFDRFYRVPRENKKEVEGFGLGLFYVKKICGLHGWKVSAKNNTPSGLTICITIPKHSLA